MPKGDNRLKILYVLEELKENSKLNAETQEDRFLSATALIAALNDKYNLNADRKSVYNYIDSLIKYGYDIEKSRRGYYLREHYNRSEEDDFEEAELKMIVDALTASRFISATKTNAIIRKLSRLSESNIPLTERLVYCEQAVKSDNSSVIYSIDAIHNAITHNHKIVFKYQKTVVDYDLSLGRLVSVNKTNENNEEKIYCQSPYALVWKNDFYYVICYDSKMQATKTFRVDRMKDVMVDESSYREGDRFFEEMNIVEYANTAFSMYGGETINILLRVKMELAGVIADRFGRNITLYHDEDDQYFRCSVEVQKSQQFYSWLSGFGKDIELIYPNSLRDDYLQYLNDILQYYGSHNDLNHST